jgi:hypothetical protein
VDLFLRLASATCKASGKRSISRSIVSALHFLSILCQGDHERESPKTRRRRKKNEKLRLMVWGRSGGYCWICRDPLSFEEMTLDHVTPKSKGGRRTYANLRAAHGTCNSRRGNRDLPRPADPSDSRGFLTTGAKTT